MLHSPVSRRWLLAASLTLGLLLFVRPAGAISHRTLTALTGVATNNYLGWSVAGAGDFNGDGFADVIVGAPYNSAGGPSAGQAYVYYGGPAADNVADLTFTGAAAGDYLGMSVAGAGDINGDGYADVIVGAWSNDAGGTDAGRAYVYFGGPGADNVADLVLTGATAGDHFGGSVAGAGDVNGDGYADVIVGAPYYSAFTGRAYVYFGGPGADATADLIFTGAAGDQLGNSVAGAGDMNGDGYADVIVGAWSSDAGGGDAGRAYVYFGGPGADSVADLTFTGAAAGDLLGMSVAGAGDVNGDGYADVIVGAWMSGVGGVEAGQAYVYYGGPAADGVPDLTFTGAAAEDHLGYSVAGAGDVNGDGYADAVAGASGNDAGATDAGRVYVYFGGAGADNVADLILTGAASGDYLGNSVAGAGDFNGDGLQDLIAGARNSDAGAYLSGQAYVYAIYPFQVLSPNGGEQWVGGEPATVRWLGHDPADLAVSYNGGSSWSTLAAGVGGLEENEYTLTAPYVASKAARIRLTYAGQSPGRSTSDASDGLFQIVLPAEPPAVAHRVQFTPTGAAAGDYLGWSAASAGDFNGDGYADVIAGAYGNDAGGSNAGRAYVYFGGPGANAVADLTVTGAAAGDQFGFSVASAGDVNGDGYADIIVGAPYNDAGGTDAGRVYVYFGGPAADNVPDLTLTGAAAGDNFGRAVAGAGDLNGDGYADLVVGAPFNDTNGTDAGRAYAYFGGPTADNVADVILTGATAGDNFGIAVASAGDVNGDGFADIVVAATGSDAGATDAGRAYVYLGGRVPDATADLIFTGATAADRLGRSVAGAGDFNGDGYADVIAGAWGSDAGGADAGRAYVYFGGPGADNVADLVLTGAAAGDRLGWWVAGAGDVNGDGFADMVVGAYQNDSGATDAGRAYVYFGGPGADNAADLVLTGVAASDAFGWSVAGAGDVNGDGFADLLVGAIDNDTGGTDAGRVYLYDFNRYFVTAPNGGEIWNVGATKAVTWLGAESADLWLSVDGGKSYDLLRSGVGGSEGNTLPLRVPHSPSRFSRFKVTPSVSGVGGFDESDSLLTIQTSVSLLSLKAEPGPGGATLVSWSTDPGMGPEGLAGYRLYRVLAGSEGNGVRIGPELIVETSYTDSDGGIAGSGYRLCALNGLQEELELGRIAPAAAFTGMRVWPSPARAGSVIRVTISAPGLAAGGLDQSLDVAVYDLQGRRVATLTAGAAEAQAGQLTLTWDGKTAEGAPVASGVYFVVARSTAPLVQLRAEQRLVIVR